MAKSSGAADEKGEQDKPKRQKKEPKNADAVPNDYHSFGNFCYATDTDSFKARALEKSSAVLGPLTLSAKPSVEELMEAADLGQINIDMLDGIQICWNPGKKGLTQDLEQVNFSIRDSLLTRKQLSMTPILTREAAECIIDFCPDLLWKDLLLRITSETSLRNMEVRDRMCMNGNYMDQATITKRIGSALGKKQDKKNNDGPEEDNYYAQNAEDMDKYQRFFGKVLSTRKSWAGQSGRSKRNGTEDADSSASGSRPGSSGSDRSTILLMTDAMRPGSSKGVKKRSSSSNMGKGKAKVTALQLDGAADEKEETESEESDAVVGGKRKALDEVSLQSDGELDRLADDST